MACWQTMSFVRSWYDQYMIIVVLAVHWVHVSWVMLIACPIMSPSCPSVLQPWTPPKETNETTGALILAVAGAVLGFSESSDELLILIDVSEDVISIVYVWWYDVIVCYSYTVIIHYNPIYIYIYMCIIYMTSYLWYIAMLQLFQPVQSGWTEVVFVTIAACPWLAVDSPRVVVFFLGPFLQSYFQTISTPWPPVSRFPMYKDTAGSWVAAMAAISCDTWGYDAQRQSLGRESIVSAFFLGL